MPPRYRPRHPSAMSYDTVVLESRDDRFIEPWIIDSFDNEYDFFVRRAHIALGLDSAPNDQGLAERVDAFERAFHSLVGPYFSGKEQLDAILQDANRRTT